MNYLAVAAVAVVLAHALVVKDDDETNPHAAEIAENGSDRNGYAGSGCYMLDGPTTKVYDEQFDAANRVPMTPSVCFKFCRDNNVDGFGSNFFSIANGRECTCMQYLQKTGVDSDNSACDMVCQGDADVLCGNANGKSSTWEMHFCADTASTRLETALNSAQMKQIYRTVDLASAMYDDFNENRVATFGNSKGSATSRFQVSVGTATSQISEKIIYLQKAYSALIKESEDFLATNDADAQLLAAQNAENWGQIAFNRHTALLKVVRLINPPSVLDYDVLGTQDLDEHAVNNTGELGEVENLAYLLSRLLRRSSALGAGNDMPAVVPEAGNENLQPAWYWFDNTFDETTAAASPDHAEMASGTTIMVGSVLNGMPMQELGNDGCYVACDRSPRCVAYTSYQMKKENSQLMLRDMCFLLTDVEVIEHFACTDALEAVDTTHDVYIESKVKLSHILAGFKPPKPIKTTKCFGTAHALVPAVGIAGYLGTGELTFTDGQNQAHLFKYPIDTTP